MHVAKRVVLKIQNPDNDLLATMQAYSDGMNYASRIIYQHNKPMTIEQLHNEAYYYLREQLGLRAQQCRGILVRIVEMYKELKASVSAKRDEWRYLKFTPSSMMLSYKKEFRIGKGIVKITTLDSGRKKYQIYVYDYARRFFDGTWMYVASKIVRHDDGNHYFHLEVEKSVPNAKVTKDASYMGIDVGLNNYAVAATSNRKCKFFAAGRVKDLRNKYQLLRKRLHIKGTSSAKRVMKRLADKEKRLMQNLNHEISKEIVQFAIENNVRIIGLEDLYGLAGIPLQEAMKRGSEEWFHRQLQVYVQYKAAEAGIWTEYVDPCHTSQACSSCGHISKNNRDRLKFKCLACGYENNADLNAAMNIETKVRDNRQCLCSPGRQSAAQTSA